MDRTIASMLLEQELAQARQRGYGHLAAMATLRLWPP
jgi:hypothetical protein